LGDRIYHGQVGGATCTGCHGTNATGTPLGPDLTKQKWMWSDGSFAGILKVITEGVAHPKQYRSPMPPMGGAQLSDTQASAVAAYVWALSHKTTSGAKGPSAQLLIPGEKLFRESPTPASDGRVILGTVGARTAIFVVNPGSSAERSIQPDHGTLSITTPSEHLTK
jgi:cytochrome c553